MTNFDTTKLRTRLGLTENGRAQKVLDSSVLHYLRETMPVDTGVMRANTRIVKPGLIQVQTPYAHYMNEGILYVMPGTDKGAYFSPTYGFWSKPGVKKVPSNRKLNYRGGAERGAHFVERTCRGHFEDILQDVKDGIK